MILVIDNYDSFTYNIVQYLEQLDHKVVVERNDTITLEQIEALKPDQILISPGPSNPDHAGISLPAIKHFAGKIPIFGVCLGHQCIGQAFGGKIVRAQKLYHGKTSQVEHRGTGVFSGLPSPFTAARYHSLVIEATTCPADLEVTATSEDGEIMGVRHRTLAVEGIQFHPESIATEHGFAMLENFLKGPGAAGEPRIRHGLKKIVGKQDLSLHEAETIMLEIGRGAATPAQIGAFLSALAMKGESAEELAGFVKAMRQLVVPVKKPDNRMVVDVVGTGGDHSHTFNISTTAAFVAAGAGLTVAKHGNRSITSKCGSADVLESLGVDLNLTPEAAAKCLEKVGMVFLFAQKHHPGMKHAAPVRKDLGLRTVFNMVGPLTNPTGAQVKLIGVYAPHLTELFAQVLRLLGHDRGMVVHGHDGLDEITLTGTTQITELKDGWTRTYQLDPITLGLRPCRAEDLKGGEAPENAQITRDILNGKLGPHREITLLNAAAALVTAGKAGDFASGLTQAAHAIDSGAARAKLEALAAFRA